jgi:hypothetical protein
MWTRRLVIMTVTVLSLAAFFALTVKFYRNPFDPMDSGRSPVEGEYVHQTREAILSRFGTPSHQWQGYYGNPDLSYTSTHSPSITMTYIRPTGVLYLSFEEVNGEWICYSSHWMPDGWVF